MFRTLLPLCALLLVVVTAGCVGGPAGQPTPAETTRPTATATEAQSPTATATATEPLTPPPNRTVAFPAGPKERPALPANLTAESVGEFAKTHEYRYAYNQLWYGDHTDVTLSCELRNATAHDGWYGATVSCTGYSNTGGESTGTETAAQVHADWFTQTFAYAVDENSLVRERAEDGRT